MNALCNAVRTALESAKLLCQETRLLCAVSGGADSVALLHAVSRVQKDIGFALHAIHVQHGLRGEDSRADEQFVRTLCDALHVPLHVYAANLGSSMHEPGAETRARDARRSLFAQCMAETQAHALLTAHHRDDQAETVLMHLLRGSGMSGLCGMPACAPFAGGVLLRPLLCFSKADLLRALAAETLPYREDLSNQDAITPRNALRLTVLPAVEALYPGAGKHIAQAAEALANDEAFLQAEAEKLYRQTVYHVPPLRAIAKAPLQNAPSALTRRVLRRCYAQAARPAGEQSLSHADTLALEALLHAAPGASHNLPGGWTAVNEADFLHLTQTGPLLSSDEAEQPLRPDGECYRFRHAHILQSAAGSAIPHTPDEAVLTPEMLALAPVLRMPRPDDRIHPLGAPGSKPLRRFLTDRKVDPFFRYQRPVLASGQDILWVPALCTAEALRLAAVPPGSIRLTYMASIPTHQSKE